MPKTRAQAVGHALYTYSNLVVRAHEAAGSDAEYVAMLAREWDERLAHLEPDSTPLSEDQARVLDHLTSTVSNDELSTAALIEWVDAFPAAVTDLLAASSIRDSEDIQIRGDFATDFDWSELMAWSHVEAATASLIDETVSSAEADSDSGELASDAGKRQSTLALAA